MLEFGLVDGIVPEPLGGAHWDYSEAGQLLKAYLKPILAELKAMSPEERINQRIEKFSRMGFWDERPLQTTTA
jgi:acetyl-CoA carboxylase carboxyl transferase subunit alpha